MMPKIKCYFDWSIFSNTSALGIFQAVPTYDSQKFALSLGVLKKCMIVKNIFDFTLLKYLEIF